MIEPVENSKKSSSGVNDVVDLELHSIVCGTRLCVPVQIARQVVATIQGGGVAMLLCTCGQVQSIRQKRQKTHD